MKGNSYIVFILISLRVFCQDFDQKTILTGSKSVLIELASIENIELSMNKSSEKIEVMYRNTNAENEPIISDDGTTVHIAVAKNAYSLEGTEKNKYRAGQPLYPSYMIRIPKNMNVQLFYDKGNFRMTNFEGALAIHLNSGVVDINQFKGTVSVESFSGKINCSLNAARLDVNSNKGALVSTLKDKRLIETQNSLKGIFNNAKNVLKINTIHAKVNLKWMSTQK